MLRVYDDNVAITAYSRKIMVLQALFGICQSIGYDNVTSNQPGWTRFIMLGDKTLMSYDFAFCEFVEGDGSPPEMIDISRTGITKNAVGVLLIKGLYNTKLLDAIIKSELLLNIGISKVVMVDVPEDEDDILYGRIWDSLDEMFIPLTTGDGKSYQVNIKTCCGGKGECHHEK